MSTVQEKKITEPKKLTSGTQFRTVTVPNTNILLACIVTVCFNPILGVIAAYLSLTAARAYRDGQPQDGERRALISVIVSLVGIICTVALVMLLIIWYAVDNVRPDPHDHSRLTSSLES